MLHALFTHCFAIVGLILAATGQLETYLKRHENGSWYHEFCILTLIPTIVDSFWPMTLNGRPNESVFAKWTVNMTVHFLLQHSIYIARLVWSFDAMSNLSIIQNWDMFACKSFKSNYWLEQICATQIVLSLYHYYGNQK